MADRGQMHPRLYQYRRDRQKFSLRVYLIALVFAIITFGQWAAFKFIDEIKDILIEHYYISLATLLAALVLITFFVFFEGLRFAMPLNWLVSILTVELVTVGLARVTIVTSLENNGYSLAVVTVVTILFIILGNLISRDFTLDVVIVFICAIVFFVGSVFFAMVAIVADISYSILIYCGFVIATVLLFLMYHAQTIKGGRYAEMRLNDYLLAALIIYHDFIIIYVLSMFICTAIAGENKLFNIYNGGSCNWCNSTSTTVGPPYNLDASGSNAAAEIKSVPSRSPTSRKPIPPPTKHNPPTTISVPPPTRPKPPSTRYTPPTTISVPPPTRPKAARKHNPQSKISVPPPTRPKPPPPSEPTTPRPTKSQKTKPYKLPTETYKQSFEEYLQKYDLTKKGRT